MSYYSIDRIENDIAVIYFEKQKIDIPINELPKGAKPGDILLKTPEGIFQIDNELTLKRKEELNKIQNNLFK